jgi:hypothetical protein
VAQCHFLQNLLVLLQRPIPSQGMPEDDSEKEKQPWWKLRKWNLRIAFRLISRYGDSSFAPRGESNKAFAHLYVKGFSEPYLKVRCCVIATCYSALLSCLEMLAPP